MFTDARDVDARYGTFSNVGHSQTNNYHGTGDPYTYGSEGSCEEIFGLYRNLGLSLSLV